MKAAAEAITLRDAITALRQHPLFRGVLVQVPDALNTSPSDASNTAFKIKYQFGTPIVLGEPSFGSATDTGSNLKPGIQNPDFAVSAHASLWAASTKHNPLFVIASGLVEVHHPCNDKQESVPRAQLCHLDVLGDYEFTVTVLSEYDTAASAASNPGSHSIVPSPTPTHNSKPATYRFSATAGFRTVVCWRGRPGGPALGRLAPGHVSSHSHDAWTWSILNAAPAEVVSNLETVVYVFPQAAFLRLTQLDGRLWQNLWGLHVPRVQATTALSERIEDAGAVLKELGLSTSVIEEIRRADRIKYAYGLWVIHQCSTGVLPSLVPIACYAPFSKFDAYLALRLVFANNWTRKAGRTHSWPGACLFLVPSLSRGKVPDLYEPGPNVVLSDPTSANNTLELSLGSWWRCLTRQMLSVFTAYNVNNPERHPKCSVYCQALQTLAGGELEMVNVKAAGEVRPLVDWAGHKIGRWLLLGKQGHKPPARRDLFFIR